MTCDEKGNHYRYDPAHTGRGGIHEEPGAGTGESVRPRRLGVAVLKPSARYGKRDLFEPGAVVERPDGSLFTQGYPVTGGYRWTNVPTIMPPENRGSRLEGVHRRQAKEGSMINTMAQALLDAGNPIHRYEVARELSETGRSWLITLQGPGGETCVVSRLRSHREGNGF